MHKFPPTWRFILILQITILRKQIRRSIPLPQLRPALKNKVNLFRSKVYIQTYESKTIFQRNFILRSSETIDNPTQDTNFFIESRKTMSRWNCITIITLYVVEELIGEVGFFLLGAATRQRCRPRGFPLERRRTGIKRLRWWEIKYRARCGRRRAETMSDRHWSFRV